MEVIDHGHGGLSLLPPKPGVCQICATSHLADSPHNQQSLFYQYRFFYAHGRWPTWADAIAHCDPNMRGNWRCELTKRGKWSEPDGVDPIPELEE